MNKLFLVTVFLFLFLITPGVVSASNLYLSPASGTVGLGGTISVRINLNTGGEGVNGVTAVLAYPADQLEVAGISYSNTFGIAAEGSSGGGAIRISRGNINPVSGNVNLATISFKGKAPGSATVSFVGGSAVPRASDSSDSYTGGSGGTYNVSSAPTASSVPKATGAGAITTQTATALKISNLKVENISTNSAIISWKTDQKSDSFIEYGLDKGKYFLNSSNSNLVTEHSLKLEGPLFTPGSKFYFRVISKNADENAALSEEMELQFKGYTLKLKITDDLGNPLINTEVWIYSEPRKARTNEQGEVTFKDLPAGKHLVVVKQGEFEKTAEVIVDPAQAAKTPQNSEIKVARASITQAKPTLVYLIIGALIVVTVGVWVYIFKRWKRRSNSITP